MPKYRNEKAKENQFIEKFRLLNSQETCEEIAWSCSDSSEYEDHVQCEPLSVYARRKRKRANNKKRVSNNHSNLEITVVDAVAEHCKPIEITKSPILVGRSKSESLKISPILTPSQHYFNRFTDRKTSNNTPVSINYNCDEPKVAKCLKSPILLQKHEPKISPKVRKKLFEVDKISESKRDVSRDTRSTSPIINHKKNSLDRRKSVRILNNNENSKLSCNRFNQNLYSEELSKCVNKEDVTVTNDLSNSNHIRKVTFIESTTSSSSNGESVTKKSHIDLVSKVKSYFDSYFSSQSSQHSISECETSSPCSSINTDDIEIVNSITQVRSVTPSLRENTISSEKIDTRQKKVKYKKGGLAFRLSSLLKKQDSSVSLWQHERYLAANSSFIIPKEEFLAFRIKTVDFKYGIYLLETVDSNNDKFLIVINTVYVKSNSFANDNILKIYEPYRIIDADHRKIITNVCKFECGKLKF